MSPVRPPPAPGGKASGAVGKGTALSCRGGPSVQVVAESGVVDHLDEEAVRDGVERLRDVHHYGYRSARGLALVEARDHTSRDREQGRGGGMPRFEAVLGEASAQRLHD